MKRSRRLFLPKYESLILWWIWLILVVIISLIDMLFRFLSDKQEQSTCLYGPDTFLYNKCSIMNILNLYERFHGEIVILIF